MDLHEESIRNVTVLEVKGRIDSTTASTLGERLTQLLGARGPRLLLDLGRVEYISSAGFRVLLLAAKRAEDSAGRIALCGVSGKVAQLFDLAGFMDHFRIYSSRDDGVTAL